MPLDTRPPLPDDERLALERALAEAGIPLDEAPAQYRGAWQQAAAEEAVDCEPSADGYARSPRSTRGATRA